MAIKNTVTIDFLSTFVDYVFDCNLPGVLKVKLILPIGTQYKYNPYRNENVAALELQYCGSRAAIKF